MIANTMNKMIKNMKLSPEELKHAEKVVKEFIPKNAKNDYAEIRKSNEIYIKTFFDTKYKGLT